MNLKETSKVIEAFTEVVREEIAQRENAGIAVGLAALSRVLSQQGRRLVGGGRDDLEKADQVDRAADRRGGRRSGRGLRGYGYPGHREHRRNSQSEKTAARHDRTPAI